MRIIIESANKIFAKRNKIKDDCKVKKVKNYCKSKDPESDMKEFEKLMKIRCPICYTTLTYTSMRTHLYLHGFNNYQIDELKNDKGFVIKCPFCEKYFSNASQFRKHLRRTHIEKLSSIASGAYHTENTILKLNEIEDFKKSNRKKLKFKVRFVSGGLPSLGKRSR